ncbi:MAG: hypothetical protein AAFR83_20870 [Cyanobacteria bacterium J06629_18]
MSYKQLYAVPAGKFQSFLDDKDTKFPNVKSLSVDQLNFNEGEKISSNYAKKENKQKKTLNEEKQEEGGLDNMKINDDGSNPINVQNDLHWIKSHDGNAPPVNVHMNVPDVKDVEDKQNTEQKAINHWPRPDYNFGVHPNLQPTNEPNFDNFGLGARNNVRASVNDANLNDSLGIVESADKSIDENNWLRDAGPISDSQPVFPPLNSPIAPPSNPPKSKIPKIVQPTITNAIAEASKNLAQVQNARKTGSKKTQLSNIQKPTPSNFAVSPRATRMIRERAQKLASEGSTGAIKKRDINRKN